MLKPSLDPRLLTAADFFPSCAQGADIGADHGHLSCFLLSSGKCKHMQITDISAYSLQKAQNLLEKHNLIERADFRCGDGLNALHQPADAIAICGMGGHTVAAILRDGKEKLHNASLILCPQTELPLVRSTLYNDLGYHLVREQVVLAANRFYVMMLAEHGGEEITARQLYLGPCLTKTVSQEYLHYVKWRCDVVSREHAPESAQHLEWLKEELNRVQSAIDCQ